MKTTDEILKIKATLLYILKSFPGGVDFIKLFKILYFAQQEHLVTYGRVIVQDTFYALKHGPVPSFSYKALQLANGKDVNKEFEIFLEGIKVIDKLVYSEINPDLEELSGSNIKCLDNSILKYKDIDPYDLSELSHDDAWRNAYNRILEDPEKDRISIIEIAKSGKAKKGMINYIRDVQIINRSLYCEN